jgi:hypothetical protein
MLPITLPPATLAASPPATDAAALDAAAAAARISGAFTPPTAPKLKLACAARAADTPDPTAMDARLAARRMLVLRSS